MSSIFISPGYIPGSGTAGSYVNSMFNRLRHCQTVFQSRCTILQSYQQYTRLLISPHPCQHLWLSVFDYSHPRGCVMRPSLCGIALIFKVLSLSRPILTSVNILYPQSRKQTLNHWLAQDSSFSDSMWTNLLLDSHCFPTTPGYSNRRRE